MKKSASTKRFGSAVIDTDTDFHKPVGFCCGVEDLEPFPKSLRQDSAAATSLTSTDAVTGPNVKLSVQERGRPISAGRPDRLTSRKITLGECKRCSGPLQWYLEDEIAVARDMLANKKRKKYQMETRKIVETGRKKERSDRRDKKSSSSAKEKSSEIL